VAADLAEVGQLLGAQMPRLADALRQSPARRASRSRQHVSAPLAPQRAGASPGPGLAGADFSADKNTPAASEG
jgi:hypothetical protein